MFPYISNSVRLHVPQDKNFDLYHITLPQQVNLMLHSFTSAPSSYQYHCIHTHEGFSFVLCNNENISCVKIMRMVSVSVLTAMEVEIFNFSSVIQIVFYVHPATIGFRTNLRCIITL